MKRLAAAIILLAGTALPASPHPVPDRLWAELWGNSSYHRSNFGVDAGSCRERDFYLNTLSLNAGLRLLFDRFSFKKGLVVFVYAEHLKEDFLAKVEDSARQRISRRDNRVNLELWVPFGALRMTKYASY